MMRACLVHNGASSSGWVGEGQSLSRSVHQTQLCSVQCTLSFAPRGVCSAPSWAVCNLLCAVFRGLYAVCCVQSGGVQTRPSSFTRVHRPAAPSLCPPLFCTSGNRAISQLCSALCWFYGSPSVKIIFKLESSSLLCEPVALYAENIRK